MGKWAGILIVMLSVWAALAQIMPHVFQIRPQQEGGLISSAGIRKSGWVAVALGGCLLGWYIWNLEGRLAALSTSMHAVSLINGPTDETGLTLASWSASESSGCSAVIDASKLPTAMRDTFDVAILCGLSDPAVDGLKDTRILTQ